MRILAEEGNYELDVVTPTHNGLPFLVECIESVRQLPFPVHHILVDGDSSDGSKDYLRTARETTPYMTVISQPDEGPADALNTGHQHLRSPRVSVLNADDRLLPRRVSAYWNTLAELSRTYVIQCDARVIDEDGNTIGSRKSDRFTRFGWAVRGRRMVHPGAIIPSVYFQDGLRFDSNNQTCWDVQLFLDLASRGARFRVIPRTLVDFRLHPDSISGSGRLQEVSVSERARMAAPILDGLPSWFPTEAFRYIERARGVIGRLAAAARIATLQPESHHRPSPR